MIIYLSSPRSQLQCSALNEMPVLLSFTNWSPYIGAYQASFGRLMIDSGAFSEFTSGQSVDIAAYRDWTALWRPQADAIAGLDDIRGDWRKSLANYDAIPWGFPTFHDSDPDELLPDLVAMARERGTWLGIGLVPPRHGKEAFLRHAFERIPEGLHVHLFAGREYTEMRRIDSTDSTNWWRDAFKLRTLQLLNHLTPAECLEIMIKRYQRWNRQLKTENENLSLFD
jgi:hypothetical protein